MEILIVEDELLAVRKLTTLLKALNPNHSILGVTDGIASTVEWLHTHPSPQLILMDAADIAYFFAIDGQTYLFGQDKKSYTIDYTLETLAELLEPQAFFRVNSQCIVNAKAIDQTHYLLNGQIKLDLRPGTRQEVFVSAERQKEFKEWIGQ